MADDPGAAAHEVGDAGDRSKRLDVEVVDGGGDAELALELQQQLHEGQRIEEAGIELEDLYRGNKTRDVVMLSQADAQRLGLAEGDPVRVASEAGAMDVTAAIVDIRAGNLAMYYPEANALVPRRLDERSKTPAFKSVVVSLTKLERRS